MQKDTIIFLCKREDLDRERLGYYEAFCNENFAIDFIYGEPYLSNVIENPEKVLCLIHPEGSPYIPYDITFIPILTITFQIDTNARTKQRIKISKLFDATVVFHPGFDQIFRRHGIINTILLPHAVQLSTFKGLIRNDRIYDIGWVGTVDKNSFSERRRVLHLISSIYKVNDYKKTYNYNELASLYSRSKIVINIGKDTYPQDANLRCFEAMAAGALLITKRVNEIEKLGFKEGQHFVYYENDKDLLEKVNYYLENDNKRVRISLNAQTEVLKNHTYHNRVKSLLSFAHDLPKIDIAKKVANHDAHILFYSRFGMLDKSLEALMYMKKNNLRCLLIGTYYICRAFLGHLFRVYAK